MATFSHHVSMGLSPREEHCMAATSESLRHGLGAHRRASPAARPQESDPLSIRASRPGGPLMA